MATIDDLQQVIAAHNARIAVLESVVEALRQNTLETRGDIKEMHDVMMQSRGGWRVIAALGGLVSVVSGVAGGLAGWFAHGGGTQ